MSFPKLLNIRHLFFFTWSPPFWSLCPPAPLGTGSSLPHTCPPGGVLQPLSCVENSVAGILCPPLFCSSWNSHYSDIGSSELIFGICAFQYGRFWSLVAFEHLKCGQSKLRYVIRFSMRKVFYLLLYEERL